MTEMDFVLCKIKNFTSAEVRKTGADLKDVQVDTMVALQKLRKHLGRRIGLLYNGMTTGTHKAKEHPQGLAVDWFLYPKDGKIQSKTIWQYAVMSGFRGVGIYYNIELKNYSFHTDLRSIPNFWGGVKKDTKDKWIYFNLFHDPKEFISQRRI
ncbi:MAG TPA: hypothetical protein EYP60_04350 [bacterium (Candidatus Stahlbacteria)]|nr:hypothetical protein [Candidatus Stahlbacteria bacterium]